MDPHTLIKIAEIFLKIAYSLEPKSRIKKRKKFSKSVQNAVLVLQGFKCNLCGKFLNIINFDHIDRNRSNNHISNCQALCPNCHAKKTRKKL